jgi:hypothetical protein
MENPIYVQILFRKHLSDRELDALNASETVGCPVEGKRGFGNSVHLTFMTGPLCPARDILPQRIEVLKIAILSFPLSKSDISACLQRELRGASLVRTLFCHPQYTSNARFQHYFYGDMPLGVREDCCDRQWQEDIPDSEQSFHNLCRMVLSEALVTRTPSLSELCVRAISPHVRLNRAGDPKIETCSGRWLPARTQFSDGLLLERLKGITAVHQRVDDRSSDGGRKRSKGSGDREFDARKPEPVDDSPGNSLKEEAERNVRRRA